MSPSARTTALCVLLFVVLATARAWPRLAEPELRAEDAAVFFVQARAEGAAALLAEHNGYHHLLPRLLALGAGVAGCRAAPAIYAWSAFLVFLGLGLLVLLPGPGREGRGLMLLVLPLLPQDGTVIAHLADLGGVAALALLPLAARAPDLRRSGLLLALPVFLVAALSGPQVLFFLPVILGLLVVRRDRKTLAFAALALVAAWLQGRHLPDARVAVAAGAPLGDFLAAIGARGLGAILGLEAAGVATRVLVVLGLGTIALETLLAAVVVRRRADEALVFLAGSIAMLAATLYAYRGDPGLLLENPYDRYGFVHLGLLAFSVLAIPSAGTVARRLLVGLTIGLLLAGGLRVMARAPEPIRIGHWDLACELLEGDLPAAIPVEPGWLVDHRPARPAEDWPARMRARVFADHEVEILGPDAGRLAKIGGDPAIVLPDDAALLISAPVTEDLIASVLPRSGRPGLDEEVELIVEELKEDGRRVRLDSIVVRPLRDHATRLPWHAGSAARVDRDRLVLRCEGRGPTRWWQLWGFFRPLTDLP